MLLNLSVFAALAGCAWASGDVARWQNLSAKSGGMIKLNARTFDEITASPRNYSVAVTMTALHPQYKCQPCRIFDTETRLVAQQWYKQPQSHAHFFAVLDFPDGQDIFRRLGLQTAPSSRLYMPTEGPRASDAREPETYDMSRSPSAEAFVQFIRSSAQVPISFRRPPNYAAMVTSFALLAAVGVFTYTFWSGVRRILYGREVWAILTNLFIVSMTGGYMWNQIRHPPFAGAGHGGKINYIAGGYQNQYAAETQIIGSIYALLAFSVYTLVVTIPWISDPFRQRVAVYIWAGVLAFVASVLVTIFKTKQPGYPFGLLLG